MPGGIDVQRTHAAATTWFIGGLHAKNGFERNDSSRLVTHLGHEQARSVKSEFYWLRHLVRCAVLGKPIR
jgi:hypothetical protein